MEALGFDNIMGAEEIDTLFSDMDDNQLEETGGEEDRQGNPDNPEILSKTTQDHGKTLYSHTAASAPTSGPSTGTHA